MTRMQSIPVNADGSLSLFWYDVHEEMNTEGTVFLFGKCQDPKTKKFGSVCVQVKNMERIMYAVPKDRTSDCTEVHEEFKQIMSSKFPKIKEWRARPIEKNYAFELPIENGAGKFLEIRYGGKY